MMLMVYNSAANISIIFDIIGILGKKMKQRDEKSLATVEILCQAYAPVE